MLPDRCSLFENIHRGRNDVNDAPTYDASMITRLGEKVRRLRERATMTQTELARQAGLSSKGYISDVESGKKIPPAERILALAMIFHVTTDYLLRDELDDLDAPDVTPAGGGPENKANKP